MKKKKLKKCPLCKGRGVIDIQNWMLPNDVIEEICPDCNGKGKK